MSDKLEAYISFLTPENQELVDNVRLGAVEHFTILSIIHWVSHSESVLERLSMLIVQECQDILDKFKPNKDLITSMASLTLRPDKCRAECFGDWVDYDRIVTKVPYLEAMLGKPMPFLPKPTEVNRNAENQVFNYITGAKVDGQ